jgi:hypothetical protein
MILQGAIVDDGVNATFTLATDALFARQAFGQRCRRSHVDSFYFWPVVIRPWSIV